MSTSAIWLCWEYQRRNQELARTFDAEYLEINYDSSGRLSRYILSLSKTISYIAQKRPRVVFAQAPSLILIGLCAFLKPIFGYALIIDAHNAAVDDSFLKYDWMKWLVRFGFRKANFVIVSNEALFPAVTRLGGSPRALPDALPTLACNTMPARFERYPRPHMLLVSTFAQDEPIAELVEAALSISHSFTLFISGRKAKAGRLLEKSSERIVFTDFLPHDEFDGLLSSVDLVIDLSTLDNCLVCGAYEALSAGVPMMLSESPASVTTFKQGAIHTQNEVESYRSALEAFFPKQAHLKEEVTQFRETFQKQWLETLGVLRQEVRDLR